MTAVLALGSNVGDRLAHLRVAVEVLQPHAVSPVYETDPVGDVDQGAFLNAVVLCELTAEQAWQRAQAAESRAGRTRSTRRWGPRTLDVDVVDAPPPVPTGLAVPHPRAHERAFVLVPWADVQPEAVLPGHGSVQDLLDAVDRSGVRAHAGSLR